MIKRVKGPDRENVETWVGYKIRRKGSGEKLGVVFKVSKVSPNTWSVYAEHINGKRVTKDGTCSSCGGTYCSLELDND